MAREPGRWQGRPRIRRRPAPRHVPIPRPRARLIVRLATPLPSQRESLVVPRIVPTVPRRDDEGARPQLGASSDMHAQVNQGVWRHTGSLSAARGRTPIARRGAHLPRSSPARVLRRDTAPTSMRAAHPRPHRVGSLGDEPQHKPRESVRVLFTTCAWSHVAHNSGPLPPVPRPAFMRRHLACQRTSDSAPTRWHPVIVLTSRALRAHAEFEATPAHS